MQIQMQGWKAFTGFMLAAALTLQPVLLSAQDQTARQAQQKDQLPSVPHETAKQIGLPDFTKGRPLIDWYRPFDVPGNTYSNSPRVDMLMKDGKIMLSLSDALMMAIENNVDVAIQRLNAPIADTDILRTKAGVSSRVGQAFVSTGSSLQGVTGGSFAQSVSAAPLFGGAPGFQNGTSSFDPYLTSTFSLQHAKQPITSVANTVTQTGVLVSQPNTGVLNLGYTQAFATGTNVSAQLNDTRSTNVQNTLIPQFTSSLAMQVTQHLMDGFGRGPNMRAIHIAKNNREVSDLVFKLQIVTTVSQVQSLYWDLVSASENIKVQQRSLQVSEKLYNDNKRQVEIGTLAPIEVVRAEAEVASGRQNLIVAETNFQQLGTAMKNLILSNISDPTILTAQVIPTDKITVPPVEPVVPVQDLVSSALSSRVELQQSRINMNNRDLSIKTTKNSLLPQVDAFVNWSGLGVAGTQATGLPASVKANPALVGGLGTSLGQAFGGDFPTYAYGLQVTVPLRNRSAQADLAQAQLERRQSDLRMHQVENQVRVEVANAQISLLQGRAQIDAARKQRELAERSLDAEQKKFQLGASTNYLVIQAQRDLTTALSQEVTALGTYMKAKVELDRATGQTLVRSSISVDDAFQGQLKRPPTGMPTAHN